MSQRALTLPLRTRVLRPQWICRRCLATQPEASTSSIPDSIPNSMPPTTTPPQPAQPARSPHPILSEKLGHDIPPQYLLHSTSNDLHPEEKAQREKLIAHKDIRGVVVSAGLMDKTVRVRVPGKRWNKRIGKYFASYTQHLVHDPNNSLVVGDVIEMHRLKVSSQVLFVVGAITSPFGKPVSERPPIPTPDERLAKYKEQRFAKLERRSLRRQAAWGDADAIKQLQSMGLDPGHGVEAGKGKAANVQKGVGKKRNPTPGAILGEKGQKLPKGVLPGGKHEVGKIDERAKQNKGSAMRMNEQAEANLLEAKRKQEALGEQGLGAAGAELPRKSSVGDSREQ